MYIKREQNSAYAVHIRLDQGGPEAFAALLMLQNNQFKRREPL